MMTNNPKDIRLNAEDRQRLALVADKKGTSWRTVFREAIANYEQTFVPAEEMHRAVSALEEDTVCLAQCAQELRDIEAELGRKR